MLTPYRPADTSRGSSRPRRRAAPARLRRLLSTCCRLQRTENRFLRTEQNDSAELRPSSARYHVKKMAAIGFRFRFFAACLLSAIVIIATSTAEKRIKQVDEWSLPDTQAFVGKLFRYWVTPNRPCAAHYKVNTTNSTCRHLSELFRNFKDFLISSAYTCLSVVSEILQT